MVGEQPQQEQEYNEACKWEPDAKGTQRLKDAKGYRLRAAGLCIRYHNNERQLLLVTGRNRHDHWVVPGGGIEEFENSQEAALRELEEEAGIKAVIKELVGEFTDHERLHRTKLYLMSVVEVLDDWDDGRNVGRQRRWMTIQEALENIKQSQRGMIRDCVHKINSH